MSWIEVIPYAKATGVLKTLYDRVKGPNNKIDNVLTIHSLRPHSLKGHMVLYKNVLHHKENQLPKWYLETIGTYVSMLNACDYCVAHHSEGLKRLLQNDARHQELLEGMKNRLNALQMAEHLMLGLKHAEKLTLRLSEVKEVDIIELRNAGFSDGEILEINQVTSYFNYVNRTVLGLGVSLKGDILGLSPGDDDQPDNWSHH